MDSKVLEQVNPHMEKIYLCIRFGFNQAILEIESMSKPISNTTKSNLIRDYIISAVKDNFAEDMLFLSKRLVSVKIGNILIRFKKLNRKSRVAGNIPTKQARNFSEQRLRLIEQCQTVNLNAGYTIDKSGQKIESIFLTCPKNQFENHWVLNIGDYIENSLVVPKPAIVRHIEQYQEIKVAAKEKVAQERKLRRAGNE